MVFRNADLPELFHSADAQAIARQGEAVGSTRAQLVLLVVGAAVAALPWRAELGGGFQAVGVLSALAYAGVLLLTFSTSRRKAKSQWQLNRSAADFIKSMCWRYAVHGAPFDAESPDVDTLFTTRVEEQLQELRTVGWDQESPGASLITRQMRELRAKSFEVRKETYVRDRLIEQRNWYRRKQEVSRLATLLWSSAFALLTLVALVLCVLRALSVTENTEVAAVASAAAASGVAWSEFRRHQPLISAHALVEEKLKALHLEMESRLSEKQWSSVVYETERVVSPQYTDWLARHGS
ncbi:DUF4231 domain-containing protein [Streptomyces sp. NBC_01267]|uniref:DUF4231 domain-containing protein n=1 Tax=unclassified Streptomyces TaxID=2593676 RepID=UPI002E35AE64|nr:DUF4231 domain-containing protein [Streptomyces sp. NBC_01267]WSV57246.1 DUF4231 domain-containing protein [Streptomyces sp. NBC_01014]